MSRISKNKKWTVPLVIVIAMCFICVPSFIIEEKPQAKGKPTMIYINQTTSMYKSKGKGKYKAKLAPSIYRQYSKSGSWHKVKNPKTKKYVWIKNAKNLSTLQTKTNGTMEKEIIRLVNKERKKRGVAPVKEDTTLKKYTHFRSNDMAVANYFGHSSPKYGRWANFLYTSEYSFQLAGENLAAGFTSANAFVKGWMNSPSHKKNVLNPRFKRIGVTVVNGTKKSDYNKYATQWFAR